MATGGEEEYHLSPPKRELSPSTSPEGKMTEASKRRIDEMLTRRMGGLSFRDAREHMETPSHAVGRSSLLNSSGTYTAPGHSPPGSRAGSPGPGPGASGSTAVRYADLPKFAGKRSSNVNRFLRLFEGRMQLYSVKPSRWNMNMLAACSGDAYDYCYQALKDFPELTWSQLAELMRSRYKAGFLEKQALLGSRQERTESVDDYSERLRSHPAWDAADGDLQVSTFIQGLKPKLKAAIILHHPQSLRQAIELACTAEALAGSSNDGAISVAQSADGLASQVNKMIQPVLEEVKAIRKSTPLPAKAPSTTPWRRSGENEQKNKQGARAEEDNNRGRGQATRRAGRGIRCWGCQMTGHVLSNCPNERQGGEAAAYNSQAQNWRSRRRGGSAQGGFRSFNGARGRQNGQANMARQRQINPNTEWTMSADLDWVPNNRRRPLNY